MALLSDQSRAARGVELPRSISVIDVIEMKPGLGLAQAPGMVAVLDAFPAADPGVYVGRTAAIRHACGRVVSAEVEAARDHRATISFFFRDLTPADVPIGCEVSIDG